MLSILIPTYNYNAYTLVKELHNQLRDLKILFEIICIDDGSKSELNKFNLEINSLSHSTFILLEDNIGRSAVRNLLSEKAKYKWLLFLDSDVYPKKSNFINEYLDIIERSEYAIISGGISYKIDKSKKLLRWKLGKNNEEKSVFIRSRNPYKYFFTANFLIKKSIMELINFNEDLIKYGYEDLLFSKSIKNKSIKIKQVNNSVFHLGIDSNETFLNKTKSALENLSYLIQTNQLSINDVRIYSIYNKLKKYKISGLFLIFIDHFQRYSIKKSSLLYYNLFRIAFLDNISKNSK